MSILKLIKAETHKICLECNITVQHLKSTFDTFQNIDKGACYPYSYATYESGFWRDISWTLDTLEKNTLVGSIFI